MKTVLSLPLVVLLTCAPAHAADGVDFFETKVRPVLVEHCYACHSHAKGKTKGGLALDDLEALRKGGGSGPLFVAHDPERSLLVRAVGYREPEVEMPPDGPIPKAAVAAIEAWVKMGAPLPAAPKRGAVAWRQHWAFQPPVAVAPPAVKRAEWVKSPVDAFVLAKLEAKGLAPRPAADRRTLIRRASFDLTGLPPTEREIQAFENDRAPDAFAKVVDRLLASPHHGERWARHWLDVARYADTKGYVYDGRDDPRFVHSFAYRDWVIRAFNEDLPYDRFLIAQLAADQDPAREKDPRTLAAMGFLTVGRRFINNIHDIIDDRIDTVARGMLGLTVSCARCHDHKYDPIPIDDYYSLYGVFAGSAERAVPIARPGRGAEHVAFQAELRRREEELQKFFDDRKAELLERLRKQVKEYLRAVLDVEKLPTEEFYQNLDPDDVNPVIVRQWNSYIHARKGTPMHPVFGPWHLFQALPPSALKARAPEVLRAIAASPEVNALVKRAFLGATVTSMTDVADLYARAFAEVNAATPGDAAADELRQVLHGADSPIAIPRGSIPEVEWVFDEGTRTRLGALQMAIDAWILEAPGAPPHAAILEDRPLQTDPRIFRRGNPATKGDAVPRRMLALLAGADRRPFQRGSGRLELARAIASPDNPLTARVLVNRVWKHHFNAALVGTPSDFGMRADAPTHPELLDWLAVRFVKDGWSLKRLHRLLMLSAVYQQASDDDPRARAIDPANALYWRMNRRRLDFEEMRDSILAVAGTLDRTVGGRPVSLTAHPSSRRRSVYGFVDRLNLPGMMRTFDFAGPDAHSPQRLLTTVPQQALFMMNSSFVLEQARNLARRREVLAQPTPERKIDRLYRIALGRPPTEEEVDIGRALVADLAKFQPPEQPAGGAWSFLCGSRPFPYFLGDAWSVSDAAYPQSGRCRLTRSGGQPGARDERVVIRRWTAPADLTVAVSGQIEHRSGRGDGIRARLASSRGELAAWTLKKMTVEAKVEGIEVKRGETLDFVVDSRGDATSDEFRWAPVITSMTGPGKKASQEWNASREFAGPRGISVETWDKYAQVLLESNELVFVD